MSEQKNWAQFEAEYKRMIDENVRLKQFHDNIMNIYHETIGNHEITISVHALGDELAKLGELKEVQIIE